MTVTVEAWRYDFYKQDRIAVNIGPGLLRWIWCPHRGWRIHQPGEAAR